MKPELKSKTLLGVARSQAKMIEFAVPPEDRIEPSRDPAGLFPLSIAMLGDLAARICRGAASTNTIGEAKQSLRFSAFFFDAYFSAHQEFSENTYLSLLSSAAYYLSDLPGSSAVLVDKVSSPTFDPACHDLDRTLAWLLRARFSDGLQLSATRYRQSIVDATAAMNRFYTEGRRMEEVLAPFRTIRNIAYEIGGPREVLLADLLLSVAIRRLQSSSRSSLAEFTDVPIAEWEPALRKGTFIKEFWPAQRLLGEQGVFRGRSAVIQMPTSAGKTKATEILIRSAFLSNRTLLAIVVAPFRALCHEIRDAMLVAFRGEEDIRIDEISDVPQNDFELDVQGQRRIVILTPEKLLYLLRQMPEIAPEIGLLVYDEGHQFDTGVRGVTYELLIASLKDRVPPHCQVVLVSAVISNAAAINGWLNGADGLNVTGPDLHPNFRSVAFASWTDTLGRLEFPGQPDSGNFAYFVPRVIEQLPLARLSTRETTDRFFPDRTDGQSVGIYLALKLIPNGSIAIFCGLKGSVTTVCDTLADAFRRGLDLPQPVAYSNRAEVEKLTALITHQMGEDSVIAQCAELGVFTHHGNTPGGIRLCVEHAMKKSLVKVVVCTSTLAQGVNLPIRYLIITGVYQGSKRISVRDFQNLIGRAGRSGMHTEGSVIFADPQLYDEQAQFPGRRRWIQAQQLLDPTKAEACISSLLSLFEPLHSDDNILTADFDVTEFVRMYLDEDAAISAAAEALHSKLGERFKTNGLALQLQARGKIIDALESYLMAASSEGPILDEAAAVELAQKTLAYHLADENQRDDIEQLFTTLAAHVAQQVPDAGTRKAYSKSLSGVRNSIAIHQWATTNVDALDASDDDLELLRVLWPLLSAQISNSLFRRCTKPEMLSQLAEAWISDKTPAELLAILVESDTRFGDGDRPRRPLIDHVIELCENALAFEGTLVLAAVSESLSLSNDSNPVLAIRLSAFQKRLKYGLSSNTAIILYEMGFADRTVSNAVSEVLATDSDNENEVIRQLLAKQRLVTSRLTDFPSYFSFVASNIFARHRQTR